jgi:hypothetical protein
MLTWDIFLTEYIHDYVDIICISDIICIMIWCHNHDANNAKTKNKIYSTVLPPDKMLCHYTLLCAIILNYFAIMLCAIILNYFANYFPIISIIAII